MSERPKAEAATGYFRSTIKKEKPLIVAGAIASAAIAVSTLASCNSSEEVTNTPTNSPIPESVTPTATPEIAPPVVEKNPHPDIPQIDDKYKTDWDALRAFVMDDEANNGGPWVENEKIEISSFVGTTEGIPPHMLFMIKKPTSAEEAIAVRNEYYFKFCDAIAPVKPENISFGITTINSGDMYPYETIGLVGDKRAEFENLVCPTQ